MGDRDIRAHYDELSAAYQRDRNHRFFDQSVAKYLELLGPKPGRTLEVGCGTGAYVAELLRRGIDAHGVDFSPQMVEVAKATCRAAGFDQAAPGQEERIRCADCEESMGFPGCFDSIALVDSWESFPHPGKVIRNAEAALRPGGRLLILTPNFTFKPFLWTLETLRIKKLRPAFVYGNSRVARTRELVGPGFRELALGSFFLGLERFFLFEKKGA